VCDQEWDVVLGNLDLLDSAEFVLGLLSGDTVDGESTFGVIDQSEVLVGLVNSDDVHVSGGVFDIGPDLSVDLDHAAHHNLRALFAAQSVLESVSDEDG